MKTEKDLTNKALNIDNPMNLLSTHAKIEGTITLGEYTHFNAELTGTLVSTAGSTLIIGEQGVIEGTIKGDVVVIDGFVRGEITATTKVTLSETARVVGKIQAPLLSIAFGAYFEGSSNSLKETAGALL